MLMRPLLEWQNIILIYNAVINDFMNQQVFIHIIQCEQLHNSFSRNSDYFSVISSHHSKTTPC